MTVEADTTNTDLEPRGQKLLPKHRHKSFEMNQQVTTSYSFTRADSSVFGLSLYVSLYYVSMAAAKHDIVEY
jgi:hypothetical protein